MVSTVIQCSVPVYRVKELISSDLGHELIDSRAERFLCYSKKCVCMQMADGEELLGRAQSRQLLKDLPLTTSSTYTVQSCVSEEIAFINRFNRSVSLFLQYSNT